LVEFGRRMKSIEKCPKTTKSNVFDSILFIIFSASSKYLENDDKYANYIKDTLYEALSDLCSP